MNDDSFKPIYNQELYDQAIKYWRENPTEFLRQYFPTSPTTINRPNTIYGTSIPVNERELIRRNPPPTKADIYAVSASGRAAKFTNVPVYGELPPDFPVTWEERAEAGIIEANKKSSPYTGAIFAQEQSED